MVVLLSTLQGLAGTALAQNQGIGGVSQSFEGAPDQAGDYPPYRIEVLAFAYNRFDPDEEIFPEEPFQIRLDTRPPTFLIIPPPVAADATPDDALADPDQFRSPGESGDPMTTDVTPEPANPLPTPAVLPAETRPETETVSGDASAGDALGVADDLRDAGGLGEAGALADADDLEGETAAEADPIDEFFGPADGASLDLSFEASLIADGSTWPEAAWSPIRSAYVQRLIASLKFLEDPSSVPIVFDPIPESALLPGLDDLDPNAPQSDTTDPGTADIEEPARSIQTPRPTFRVLRADELELRAARQRLGRDDAYTPLAHGGWIVPAYPPDQAVPIDISMLGTVNPVGTVKLHLSRFLHVTVDLVYRAPPVPGYLQAATVDAGRLSELELPARYALRAQRRVRSGEVNYLDHPAIGVLVVVRPQPAEQQDTDDPLSPPRGPAA